MDHMKMSGGTDGSHDEDVRSCMLINKWGRTEKQEVTCEHCLSRLCRRTDASQHEWKYSITFKIKRQNDHKGPQ